MATFNSLPNGVTMGVGNPSPTGGPRGLITGWSPAAVRRHKRWLYSVESGELGGRGDAVTLTVKHCPVSADDWRSMVNALLESLRRAGMTRWHWVVEWTRRGVPHLHLAVYGPEGDVLSRPGYVAVAAWLRIGEPYGSLSFGQHVTEITGPVGWLKYLSKHASRGVAHYQRQGKPAGWTTTGRLWGYGGEWPIAEAVQGRLTTQEMWRVRRWVQRYAIAQARSEALRLGAIDPEKSAKVWDSVAWLRSMRKCHDRALSSVRGVSEWVPGPVFIEMALLAGWAGEMTE
jgi:hypothetical protein